MNLPTALGSLNTPSLLLDLERVRRNADQMSRRVSKLGVRLRPHIKTHKCIEIAQLQTYANDLEKGTFTTWNPLTIAALPTNQALTGLGPA